MSTTADEALELHAQGRLSAAMAAMRAVLATPDRAALDAALTRAAARWGEPALAQVRRRLDAAADARVRAVAGGVDHAFRDPDPQVVLREVSAGFDRAARVSPEAGAALYSLGDGALLAEATAGVTRWLRGEGLLRPGMRVLEVGCGAGRFLRALAPEAELVLGVELSAAMAAEAAHRLQGLPNVAVVRGSGGDLGFVADASVDLVLWVDSFPYVVQAGGDLPGRLIAESARVLRPGGRVAVFNWSYRGDPGLDARERAALAAAAGLEEAPCTAGGLDGWDAAVCVLRLSPAAERLQVVAFAPRIEGRVVAVCAHPDDETISLGGRLAAFDDLVLVHLTDGAPRDMGDARREGFASRDAYAQARAAELDAALAILAPRLASSRRVSLGVVDQEAVLELPRIVEVLTARLRGAEVVLTHAYEGGHPDHDAAALAVALACRRLEAEGAAPLRLEFAAYHEVEGALRFGRFHPAGTPERAVRLAPGALARKREAASRHASQRAVIAGFAPEVERYRLAPDYRFDAPPPPGAALYDRWGLELTSTRWREIAAPLAAELDG